MSCAVPPKQYTCTTALAPLTIDGKLNDPAWASAKWTPFFVDIAGTSRPTPRFRTRIKMLHDDTYFYIGAWMDEPDVWATLTEHDSIIFHDNDFEVFLDPDGDRAQYMEIEINALNTEWDLRLVKTYLDGGPPIDAWEIPGLKKAVWIDGTLNDPSDTDHGWSVELAIPWTDLREFAGMPCPPRPGDTWRVNFSRVEWQTHVENNQYVKIPDTPEDNWVWTPQHTINMHLPEHWGRVTFQ